MLSLSIILCAENSTFQNNYIKKFLNLQKSKKLTDFFHKSNDYQNVSNNQQNIELLIVKDDEESHINQICSPGLIQQDRPHTNSLSLVKFQSKFNTKKTCLSAGIQENQNIINNEDLQTLSTNYETLQSKYNIVFSEKENLLKEIKDKNEEIQNLKMQLSAFEDLKVKNSQLETQILYIKQQFNFIQIENSQTNNNDSLQKIELSQLEIKK